jgi:hypothetical protein
VLYKELLQVQQVSLLLAFWQFQFNTYLSDCLLSLHLCALLSVHLSFHLFVFLSNLTADMLILLSAHLFVLLSYHQLVLLSVPFNLCLPFDLSISLLICQALWQSFCQSFFYLFICQSFSCTSFCYLICLSTPCKYLKIPSTTSLPGLCRRGHGRGTSRWRWTCRRLSFPCWSRCRHHSRTSLRQRRGKAGAG